MNIKAKVFADTLGSGLILTALTTLGCAALLLVVLIAQLVIKVSTGFEVSLLPIFFVMIAPSVVCSVFVTIKSSKVK